MASMLMGYSPAARPAPDDTSADVSFSIAAFIWKGSVSQFGSACVHVDSM